MTLPTAWRRTRETSSTHGRGCAGSRTRERARSPRRSESPMKITRLTTFIVPPRWCFLRIDTDEGISGWGEPVLEGRAHTVATAVEELGEYLIGKDPSPIEDHWTVLYRAGFYRGGGIHMSALAGIDQALWDIKGKALGVPVHRLLGGPVRERIRVYSWIGGDRPADTADAARECGARGFTAVKMNATEELQYVDTHAKIDAVIARVQAIREAMGPHFGIGVDFHGRVHRPMAKVLAKALEPVGLMFIEEPVLSEHAEALAEIAAHCSTPIALGERLYSRWDFKRILADGHVDIVQPDPSHAGGITETRKIAAMAEAYDVALALHCPLGPIALAANLQLDAVCYNAFIQEQSLGIHYNTTSDLLDYLKDPGVFAYRDGFVDIPQGPGLGIEIDDAVVERMARIGHRWRNPVWRHADGSVAEW
ncbi:MAG TPA: galactonate dehydratase [Gemmatimonadaceae bacterium]|nr:galactonate dehydratase [Gemmatimonadaceae bacterium]